MIIPPELSQEFSWWENNIGNGRNIKPKDFKLEIFSDVSPSGRGLCVTM